MLLFKIHLFLCAIFLKFWSHALCLHTLKVFLSFHSNWTRYLLCVVPLWLTGLLFTQSSVVVFLMSHLIVLVEIILTHRNIPWDRIYCVTIRSNICLSFAHWERQCSYLKYIHFKRYLITLLSNCSCGHFSKFRSFAYTFRRLLLSFHFAWTRYLLCGLALR